LIAKGGIGIIAVSLVLFLITLIIWNFYKSSFLLFLVILLGLIFLFNVYFFRDPDRIIPDNPRAILSAADGKVVQIVEEFEPNFFQQQVKRVSIFLSIFNVHVNRIPIAGQVEYLKYIPGKFLAAFKEKASQENEQTEIGITGDSGYRVMFKQIAGIIARRIVCDLKEGQLVKAGARMGMIRYGSRVDIFFPLNAKVLVDLGQKVYGGETIIATFEDQDSNLFEEVQINEVPELEEF
jgi:phosphatidylserine decarboxylase